MMGYEDDDGDDFGLPSLSNMKRRTRRIATQNRAESSMLSPSAEGPSDSFLARRYSNSADIAIERPAPTYPMPKKSEGKILRPQYKEILKGLPAQFHMLLVQTLTKDNKTPPMLCISSTTLPYLPTPLLKKPMPLIPESHV
jgi:TBC1 domain family member 2